MASERSRRGPIASSPATRGLTLRAVTAASAAAMSSWVSNGTAGSIPAMGSGTNAWYVNEARARRGP